MEQLSKLHKAHSSLQMKYEQALDELEQLKAERERLQDELLMVRDIPFKVSVVVTLLSPMVANFHTCAFNVQLSVR